MCGSISAILQGGLLCFIQMLTVRLLSALPVNGYIGYQHLTAEPNLTLITGVSCAAVRFR